jgi:transcriptional regulator with XRE-family HTH domain
VADLAAQLRQLREDAGRLSYRQLARTAYYSHSALSQAAAGRELPSLAVTLAFAEACGGDRQEWIARWEKAAVPSGAVTHCLRSWRPTVSRRPQPAGIFARAWIGSAGYAGIA